MTTRFTTAALAAATLTFALPFAANAASSAKQTSGKQTMATRAVRVTDYESNVKHFKPTQGLAATNRNDVRRFVYEWFTQFEHAAPVDYYLSHLDNKNMSLAFPGMAPLASHADFTGWYSNLLAQTLWNFHEVSALQIQQTGSQKYLVSFVIDWYGEVKPDSAQLAGWQSRSDSNLYHRSLRQTWTVRTGERLVVEKLVVTPGDTPSPINE
jgi:hypothetical protein